MTEAQQQGLRDAIQLARKTGKGIRTAGLVGSLTTERVYLDDHEDRQAGRCVFEWWKETFKKPLVVSDARVTEDNGDEVLHLMGNGYIYVMSCEGSEVWKAKTELVNGKLMINLRLPGLKPKSSTPADEKI